MSIRDKVKVNFKFILSLFLKIAGGVFSGLTVIQTFVAWDGLNILPIWIKVLILFGLCIFSFILALILTVFVFKTTNIWTKGKNKVTATYSDIFKLGFNKRNKKNKIIVIPVNDTFDTIVEIASETNDKPLVDATTIHGQWIAKICNSQGISSSELNDRIQKSLKMHRCVPQKTYTIEEKPRGNRESFDFGTTAIIDGANKIQFYLTVISKFDGNNNAQSGRKIVRDSVETLLDFYDQKGQSIPMYIPLMGTGKSRAGMSHELSFKVIKSCVLTSEIKITGEICIVVFTGDKDKVSIWGN